VEVTSPDRSIWPWARTSTAETSVSRAVAEPGDGVAFPVVADLPAALHELAGDQFDVADGESVA
jgi:hypothetical protein